jgi:hypothetical protein
VTLENDGALQRALLSHGNLRVTITPKDKALRVNLEARNWQPPMGLAVVFDDLAVAAVFEPQQAVLTAIDGRLGPGTVKGTAKASWARDIRVEGTFTVTNGELGQLLSAFTRDFTASGTLTANATYQLQGTRLENLFAEPRVDASFTLEKGLLNNVDIVRAVQSAPRDGLRGGRTQFNDLSGSLQLSNKTYSYRQLRLSSGPMQATGGVDIAPNGDLSGRVSAEVGSKTIVVARGSLTVTGNIRSPVLKP